MKKKVIRYICIIGIFVFICFFIYGTKYAYANDNPKSVVILNSYHKGLSWTDQQTDGVISILYSTGNTYSIAVEYMDWKHYPTDENLNNLYSHLKHKYSHRKTDLIITTDDAALEFALKNRASIFSNAPVVFAV